MNKQALSRASRAIRNATMPIVEDLERRRLLSGSISGTVWEDLNGDGLRSDNEPPLPDWTVYLDQNRNRVRDPGEIASQTDATGGYVFSGLAAGTYYVAQQLPLGWEATFPHAAAEPAPMVLPAMTTSGSDAAAFTASGLTANNAQGAISARPTDAESSPLIGLDRLRNDDRFQGIDGRGYSVAVLDTGIDLDHQLFGADLDRNGIADRIVYQYDFADNDANASDVNGHGSNVASIAAGQGSQNEGMAPGANIIALKVFSDSGNGYFSYIEQALQWVVANADAYNIAAVNMSLSDSLNHAASTQLYGLEDELAALAAQNVIVVSAAGNDYYAYAAPGVGYPAADPNSLAVGAVYDANLGNDWFYSSGARDYTTGPDRIASFSQRSTILTDIFAPGAMINGANANGGIIGYTGTSQAAPHIAGLAVLAQQLSTNLLGRRLTPAEFRIALQQSGVTIHDGDDEDDNVPNTRADYQRVDALALAEIIARMGSTAYSDGHAVELSEGETRSTLNFGAMQGNLQPAAPVLTAGSDTGQYSSDGLTNLDNSSASRRLTFGVGRTLAGALVELFADGQLIGSATATAQTTFITTNGTHDLADGLHAITATQTFNSRPRSDPSETTTIHVDTVAPPVPAAPDLAASSDSGISSTDNITNDDTPTLLVSAEGFYRIYREDYLLNGDWWPGSATQVPYTLVRTPNNTWRISIAAVDGAGNESARSPALELTIDTAAPAPDGRPAPGTLDMSFGYKGSVRMPAGDYDAFNGEQLVGDVLAQPDGKIVVVASLADPVTGYNRFSLIRYNSDGSLDTTFGQDGRVIAPIAGRQIAQDAALLPDGKILVGGAGGEIGTSLWYRRPALARFNADGTLDHSFGVGGYIQTGSVNGGINGVTILPTGKILAAGDVWHGSDAKPSVLRYNADGTPDGGFGTAGESWLNYYGAAEASAIDGMGRVYITGWADIDDRSGFDVTVARFSANGVLDPSYGQKGIYLAANRSGYGKALHVASDGRVTLAAVIDGRFGVGRLTPGGRAEEAFGSAGDGWVIVNPAPPQRGGGGANDLNVLPDGRILAAGSVSEAFVQHGGNPVAVRLMPDGSPDVSFGSNGTAHAEWTHPQGGGGAAGLALTDSGDVVIAGTFHSMSGEPRSTTFAVTRFHGGTFTVPAPLLAPASDTGRSDADGLTADATPELQLTGATAGTHARLSRSGATIGGEYLSGTYTDSLAADGSYPYVMRYMDAAGNVSIPGPSLQVVLDRIAPTAQFAAVTPVVRTQPLASASFLASEPLFGVDLPHLELSRDGGPNLLTGSQSLATTDNLSFTVGGLAELTRTAGTYVLRLRGSASGIGDAAGNELAGDVSVAWQMTPTVDVPPLYLSDLNWSAASSPYSGIRKDKATGGGALRIAGTTYDKGLGVHSPSSVTYALGGQYNRFTALVGIDDLVNNNGSAVFEVWVDGVLKKASTRRTGATGAEFLEVDLAGAQQLRLVTTTGGDSDYCDHANWADAKLYSGAVAARPTVSVSASDASAAETLAGAAANTGSFTFTRSGDTTVPLTIHYTLGGSATAGSDYTTLSGLVTIPAGAASAIVTLMPIDDVLVEGSETAVLNLAASDAYTIGAPATATVMVADNDAAALLPTVTLGATGTQMPEGYTRDNQVGLTFTRTGSTAAPLTVHYTLTGTATAGVDYRVGRPMTIPAGYASFTAWIDVLDDAIAEPTETIVATLSTDAAYTVGPAASVSVQVLDNDQPSTGESIHLSQLNWSSATSPYSGVQKDRATSGNPLRIAGTTYDKGLGVHSPSSITYSLGGQYTRFVSYVGIDDLVGNNGSAVFEVWVDGVLQSSTRRTGSDGATLVEVDLTGAQQLRLVTTTGGDSDYCDHANWADAKLISGPVVQKPSVGVSLIGSAARSETSGTANAFRISRFGVTDAPLTVLYSTGGTATAGSDYQPLDGTINFAAGQASVDLPLSLIDDSVYEGDETIILALTPQSSYAISTGSVTITVLDDETPPVGQTTYLSDLSPASALAPFGGVTKDRAISGNPLRIGGTTYARGIGVHSHSEVTYTLGGQYARFTSYVGIDDAVGNGSMDGSAVFQVWVDGVLVKSSSRLTGAMGAEFLDVNVAGAQTLKLVTTTGGDNDYKDHANWAEAKLLA